MIWFVGVLFGLYNLIKYINNKIRYKVERYDENGYRIYQEDKSNILVEFVKAKYNKYCPKIDWK